MSLYDRWLFQTYIVIASTCILVNVFMLPPFQSPDEVSHFFRAVQISDGQVFGERRSESVSGGSIDKAAIVAGHSFDYLPGQPDVRLNAAAYRKVRDIAWSGTNEFAGFGNTVMNPPFLYIPAATAIKVGRSVGMSVIDTLYMARFATGLCAFVVSAFALRFIRRGANLLFIVLLLPMTISLFGSCTQDGLAIAGAALTVAIFSRHFADRNRMPLRTRLMLGALLGCVVSARVPYLPLGLLLALETDGAKKFCGIRTLAASFLVLAIPVVFTLLNAAAVLVEFNPDGSGGVSSARQIAQLLEHPGAIFLIAQNTIRQFAHGYFASFVGILGWLDARFPRGYYIAAAAVILMGVLGEILNPAEGPLKAQRWLVLSAVVAAICMVFLALYLIWTRVGAMAVHGVQGRYLTVPLLFMALALPHFRDRFAIFRSIRTLLPLIAASDLFAIPWLLFDRYYR